jgi:hypothetical protein
MSAEELESRQMGGLGDLSEPIKRERGEYILNRPNIPPRGQVPGDIGRAGTDYIARQPSLSEQVSGKIGLSPQIKPGVTPIYDTLPANGGRVIYSNFDGILDSPPAQAITGDFVNRVVLSQRIPDGRVFLARSLRVNVFQLYEQDATGTAFGVPNQLITVSVAVNGSVDISNQNIQIDPLDGYNPVSVIAGPRDLVEVLFSANYSVVSLGDINLFVQMLVNLRGDLLLPTDLPTKYTGLSK